MPLFNRAEINHFRIAITDDVHGGTLIGIGGVLSNHDGFVGLNIISRLAIEFIIKILQQPGHDHTIALYHCGGVQDTDPVKIHERGLYIRLCIVNHMIGEVPGAPCLGGKDLLPHVFTTIAPAKPDAA